MIQVMCSYSSATVAFCRQSTLAAAMFKVVRLQLITMKWRSLMAFPSTLHSRRSVPSHTSATKAGHANPFFVLPLFDRGVNLVENVGGGTQLHKMLSD